MPPTDLDAAQADLEARLGRPLEGNELLSSLMYPKVFADFSALQEKYGPVSVLPPPIYFYGMSPGEETAITIERGKALVIRLLAFGETDEEGQVKVFFELNGQPRIVKVPNRSASASVVARRKAEEGNAAHVSAPMPGSVSSVAVSVGQMIGAGDVLLTLEAMKMETAIHAAQAGEVAELLVRPGQQVDAKDLLIVLK